MLNSLKVFLSLFVLIFAQTAFSYVTKAPLENRLDQFIGVVEELHQEGLLEGEVLVSRDGQILVRLSSEELQAPQFMIGSVSKQFFAVALLKALYTASPYPTEELKVADVKRQLHLPISHFLPSDHPLWNGQMAEWANVVTLHHLLTHTSGVRNYTETEEYLRDAGGNRRWCENPHSSQEVIELVSQDPLLFSPGTAFAYNNTGYLLIAEILETIVSLPAHKYLQQELFDPLGLSSTANPVCGRWDALKQDLQFSSLVVPPLKYDPTDNSLYPPPYCEDLSVAKGAGSIISTALDLFKWNQALHKERSLLPQALYQLLITPERDGYAYGIGIEETGLGVLLGHQGSVSSYDSTLLYLPEHDLSVVVLSNISYDFEKIFDEMSALLESLTATIPDEEKRIETAIQMYFEKYPATRLESALKLLFHL